MLPVKGIILNYITIYQISRLSMNLLIHHTNIHYFSNKWFGSLKLYLCRRTRGLPDRKSFWFMSLFLHLFSVRCFLRSIFTVRCVWLMRRRTDYLWQTLSWYVCALAHPITEALSFVMLKLTIHLNATDDATFKTCRILEANFCIDLKTRYINKV